mgnify:CR=1 FL=1
MDSLRAFLERHPHLVRPTGWQSQQPNRLVWRDISDDACCFCCHGTGLVCDDAMRQFINPDYVATLSYPIRCLRSSVCGYERKQVSDPKFGPREMRVQRYEHLVNVPVLPKDVADRIHAYRREQLRQMALNPDPQLREQWRQQLATLLGQRSSRTLPRGRGSPSEPSAPPPT